MDKEVLAALTRVRLALGQAGIRVSRIIVFGSHADGTAREHSDIDVALISDDFEGMNLVQRLETIGGALAKARIMEPVEPLAYTEEELLAAPEGSFLGDEVKMKGQEVTSSE